jgi:hypothetical protein
MAPLRPLRVAEAAVEAEALRDPAFELEVPHGVALVVEGLVELPQAGKEPGLEEPSKARTPRLDGAGLLRRTFAFDVFACSGGGGWLNS